MEHIQIKLSIFNVVIFRFDYPIHNTKDILYDHTIIHGKPCPNFINPEVVYNLQNFRFEDGDVVVASYQKSGSIILRVMLHIFFGLDPYDDKFHWLEVDGNDVKEKSKVGKRRLFRTHLPRTWLPKTDKNVLYLFVYPTEETFPLSLYASAAFKTTNFKGDWNTFHRLWMQDKLFFGSFYQHLQSWMEDKSDNVWKWPLVVDKIDNNLVAHVYSLIFGNDATRDADHCVEDVIEKADAFLQKQNPMIVWKTDLEKKLLAQGLEGLDKTQKEDILQKRSEYKHYF